MKRILVTQRVDIIAECGERRDALDQRWAPFLREIGAFPLLALNDRASVLEILKAAPPEGILLGGGNSPVRYGGSAPERDEIDVLLLDYAVTHKIPLIGVCRGMQSTVLYFGGSLRRTDSHIAVRHRISGWTNRMTNSYHGLSPDLVPPCLEITAYAEDGIVESVKHSSLPIVAIMWHPEREGRFNKDDIKLFRDLLNTNDR